VRESRIVQQQLSSAGSVISAACVSVAVVHILNKVFDSKVGKEQILLLLFTN